MVVVTRLGSVKRRTLLLERDGILGQGARINVATNTRSNANRINPLLQREMTVSP